MSVQAGKKATLTRDAILAAASRSIIRNGSQATSVDDIAREAGVARGLIHYYFGSKEALLLAVVEHACNDVRADPVDDPFAAARDQLARVRHRSRKLHNFQRLLLDFAGAALHDKAMADVLRTFLSSNRLGVEAILAGMLAANGRSASDVAGLAAVVYGAVLGIALQSELDPGFDATRAFDELERLVADRVAGPTPGLVTVG